MKDESEIPSLASGVRLRRLDDGTCVLLVPEGIVNLTATATATLELLDGMRSRAAIVDMLAQRFDAPLATIAADVDELLNRLALRGWLLFSPRAPA